MAIGLWNGIVYVAGGSPDIGASVVNTLYAYNIAANSWTTLEPMPQGSWVAGFGIIHGELYVAGGSDGVTQLNTLYIYDIASNTWTTGENMPVAAEAPGSAVLHNHLYVFGGVSPLITTQIYDPGSNTWTPWAEHGRLPVALLRDSRGQSQHRGPWRTGRRWRRARRNRAVNHQPVRRGLIQPHGHTQLHGLAR